MDENKITQSEISKAADVGDIEGQTEVKTLNSAKSDLRV